MKKILGKIAMILVIIMIANTFSGCATKFFFDSGYKGTGEWYVDIFFFPIALAAVLSFDIITSPIQITVWAIQKDMEQKRAERGGKLDGIDTFSAVNSLSERDSLTQRISSLPEEKIVPFTEMLNSFSKKENSAMLKAFNNLSEKEIASSIEALNSMSEEELIATLNTFQNVRRKK